MAVSSGRCPFWILDFGLWIGKEKRVVILSWGHWAAMSSRFAVIVCHLVVWCNPFCRWNFGKHQSIASWQWARFFTLNMFTWSQQFMHSSGGIFQDVLSYGLTCDRLLLSCSLDRKKEGDIHFWWLRKKSEMTIFRHSGESRNPVFSVS